MSSSESEYSSDGSKSKDNLLHKCRIGDCKAAYAKKSKLEVHERKHTGERPFVCNESGCSKAYTNRAHLKRHKRSVHENIPPNSPIMCTEKGCGLVLSNRYALKKHFNLIHSNSNYAYTCAICSQGFQRKGQLKLHLYVHTGEMPFKCSHCNIAFTARNKYNRHMKNHKTYTCDCGETFERWTLICAHRRTSCNINETEHKCTICNKTFASKTNLTQHLLTHVNESEKETHRCPYIDCKRSYQYKKNLNYHIAAFHEKLKDEKIKCSEPGCDRVLKSRKNFKQHLLKMHSNVPKVKKPRRPRKDKGKPKKCMAAVISGVKLPIKEHLAIINSANLNSDNVSENTPECNDAIDVKVLMVDEQPSKQNRTDQESNTFLNEDVHNLSNDLNNQAKMVVVQN